MLVVGLTGGIGSGKSTVSAELAGRGAVIIDADRITRDLQRRGQPVFEAMVERFGFSIVGDDGELDRQGVAELVFGDPQALADLNAIVHPVVAQAIGARLAELVGTDSIVVLDVPLLVESGRDDLAGMIVVDTEPDVAVGRLVSQRAFKEADARSRMSRQASREQRLQRADFVIHNDGTLDELKVQVGACWDWLRTKAAEQ